MFPHTLTSKSVALTQNVLTKLANPTRRKKLVVQNANDYNFSLYEADKPYAPSFDGTPQYVILDDGAAGGLVADATLLASTTGSVKARIRLDAVGSTARTIFSLSDANANEYFSIGITTAGKITSTLRKAAAVKWTMTLTNALEANTWYDVKIVHNGVAPVIYVDHEQWTQTFSVTTDKTMWFSGLANIDLARLGSLNVNSAGEAAGFVGDISFLEIADEIGLNRTIIAQYLMDELSGTTLGDSGSGSYDGTFGSAGAAPTWADAVKPIVLVGSSANPGTRDESDCPAQTAIWALTAETGQTAFIQEGF